MVELNILVDSKIVLFLIFSILRFKLSWTDFWVGFLQTHKISNLYYIKHLKLLPFLFKIKFLFPKFEDVFNGGDSGEDDGQVASHLKIKHRLSSRGDRWRTAASLAPLLFWITSLLGGSGTADSPAVIFHLSTRWRWRWRTWEAGIALCYFPALGHSEILLLQSLPGNYYVAAPPQSTSAPFCF